VLCLALLGATVGFLPHNFNPASIFLGDCGSLLLGYCTIVIILSLGDTGKTPLVVAGLIIYAIPIIDTTLAIARRKVSGKKISDADDQHLHHMLKRSLGVKGAVLALYAIGIGFAALGIGLTEGRARVTYSLTVVFAAFIGVTAFKIARQKQIAEQATKYDARRVEAQQAAAAPDEAITK
jgi:UDP-GlcNAc:undecaprenyl-phosphate GlcNAc-1-phosphate transferase